MIALAAALSTTFLSQAAVALSKAEAEALRRLFAAVVFEPESDARRAATETLLSRAENLAPAELRALLQLGPLRAEQPPKAAAEEELVQIGTSTLGYAFASRGLKLRYAVDLPRGGDNDRARPLLLDPGHGSAAGDGDEVRAQMLQSWRARLEEAGLKDWILVRSEILEQVGTDGLRGALPEDEVVAIFADCFRDLCARFPIDLDRCYVAGLSQTGFWAWYLGSMQPDRWAGIVPTAAVTWQVDPFLCNLRNTAVCAMHASGDEICAVAPVRQTAERLARMGGHMRYIELSGGGHLDAFLQSAQGLRWIAEHPRERYPRRLSRSVANLSEPWCAWLRLDEIEQSDRGVARSGRQATAGIDAEIAGQTIQLYSEGVERITLALAPELLDLSQAFTVLWNDRTVFTGTITPSNRALLSIAAAKCDWSALFVATLELRKPKD